MDTHLFDQQIGDLTASLGDATRRGIYISVREAAEPVTANEIATLFAIHPNVARHHLDRLVENGYLQVNHRRRSGRRGPGAGRPAKHYEPTAKEVSVEFPRRRFDLLSELLMRVIERLAPEDAARVAEEVGREYGGELAAEIGLPAEAGFDTAVRAVARAMMGVGFDTEVDDDERVLRTRFCPFGQTAIDHPAVACRLEQGIVRGLLDAAQQTSVAIVRPHRHADEDCVIEV